jgi:large subunit ribosomal protein L10
VIHTKSWRIEEHKRIKDLINQYDVVGIGDLENFPASLLQKLRKRVDDSVFKVTSKSVLLRVLEELGHKDIIDKLPNQAILILSNNDAFILYNKIKKGKAKTKAKVGWIAPEDIVVPAGDTGLPPGPALSELKKAGLKAQVKGPTISIAKDTLVTKAGEEITPEVVSVLSMLDIKPIELILDVPLIKEDGVIYLKEVLDVDSEQVYNNIVDALRAAINLGVEIVYPAKETIEPLIIKAQLCAQSLESELDKVKSDSKSDSSKGSKDSKETKDENKDNTTEHKKEEISKKEESSNKEEVKESKESKESKDSNKKENNTKEEDK